MERDPHLGRVIQKSSGTIIWWDMRDPLPDDLTWVDLPQDLASMALESDRVSVTKVEKIED